MVKSTPSNQPAALRVSMDRIAEDVKALNESLNASISEIENKQKNSDESLKSSINAVKCDLEKTNEVVAALKENIAALECSIDSSLESVESDHQKAEETISKPSKHGPAEIVQDLHMGFADIGASLQRIDAGVEVPRESVNRLISKYYAPTQKHHSQIQTGNSQVRTPQEEFDKGFCAPLRPRAKLAPDTSCPAATPSLQRAQPFGAHVGATSSIRSSPVPQSSPVPVYPTGAFNRFFAEREEIVKDFFAAAPDAKLAEKIPVADRVNNLAALEARFEARFAELDLRVSQTEATGAEKAPESTINTLEARITNLETTIGNFAEKHAQDSHTAEGLVDLAKAKHIEARIAALEDKVSNTKTNCDDKLDTIETRLSKLEINAGDTSDFVALQSRASDIGNLLACDIDPTSQCREATTGLVLNRKSHFDKSTLITLNIPKQSSQDEEDRRKQVMDIVHTYHLKNILENIQTCGTVDPIPRRSKNMVTNQQLKKVAAQQPDQTDPQYEPPLPSGKLEVPVTEMEKRDHATIAMVHKAIDDCNNVFKTPKASVAAPESQPKMDDKAMRYNNLVDKRIKALESDVTRIQMEGQSTAKKIRDLDDSFDEDIRDLYFEVTAIEHDGKDSAEMLEALDISVEERLKTLIDEIAELKQKDQSSAEKLKALEGRVAESESRSKLDSKAINLQGTSMPYAKPLRVLPGNHITEDGMSITYEPVHFLHAAATSIACYDKEKTQLLVQLEQYYEVAIEIPLYSYRSTRGPDYQLYLCHQGVVKIDRCGQFMTVSMNLFYTSNSQCCLQLDISGEWVPLLPPGSNISKSNRWFDEVSQRMMISALMATNDVGKPRSPPIFRVGQVDITNSRVLSPASIPSVVVVRHEESNSRDFAAPTANPEVKAELNSNLKYRTSIPPVIVKPDEHFEVDRLNARFQKLSLFDAVTSHLASFNHNDACGLIIAEQKRHVTVKFDLTKERKPPGDDFPGRSESEYNGSLKLVRRADMLTIERFKTTFRDKPDADAWFTCRYRLNSLGEWNLSERMSNTNVGHCRERQWRSSGNENPRKAECLKAIKGVVKDVLEMMGITDYGEAQIPVVLVT